MFEKIFFSPQVKRSIFISNKHGMYDLLHVLSNDLRLKIQGQGVHRIALFDMNPELVPNTLSTTATPDPTGTYLPTHTDRHPLPIHRQKLLDQKNGFGHFFFFFFVLYHNDAWMTPKVIDSPWNLVISDNEISIITMISTCCQVCYKYDQKIVKYFCCNLIS